MPIEDIKQSLYVMDEELLTPELLKQILAYSPDQHEVSKQIP